MSSRRKWEEQHFLGADEDAEIECGVDESEDSLDAAIRELCRKIGERIAAHKLGISRTALRRADAADWVSGSVPTSTDGAVITGSSVTVDGTAVAYSLTLDGYLAVSGTPDAPVIQSRERGVR
jgi:hypothetical protein